MTLNEYQKKAQRTSCCYDHDRLLNGMLGLAGEAGECADILKKHLMQGHPFDEAHMVEELGDVLWYIAEAASALGVGLEDVAEANITKLLKRYPDGFDAERSIHR